MGSHRTSTADKPTAEMAGGAGTGKFITVKFGNNESLLCNADCLAANLLRSLVARAHLPGDWGVSPQPDRAVSVDARVIDLTDTSGNLKELHRYRFKRANQLLSVSNGSPYIIVERLPVYANPDVSASRGHTPAVFQTEGLRAPQPTSASASGPTAGARAPPNVELEQPETRVPTHYRFEPLLENYAALYPAYQVAEEAVRPPTPPPNEPDKEHDHERLQSPGRKTSRPSSHRVSRAGREESPSKPSKKTAKNEK